MTRLIKLACILAVLCGSSVAQSKGFTIIPSDKGAACAATVQALDEALQVANFPDGERFLVACDDVAWAKVQQMNPTLKLTDHAGTIFEAHTVIIRGAMMGQNIDKVNNLKVLRHEAWHQRLMTADEGIVIEATSREQNGERVADIYRKMVKEMASKDYVPVRVPEGN